MAYAIINPLLMTIVLWLIILLLPSHIFSAKIEDNLFSSTEEKKDVVVSFGSVQEMKSIVNQFTTSLAYSTYSKEDRIYAVYQAMSGYSSKCQSSAQAYLNSASYTYHNMWSSNTMVIKDADLACVNKLDEMNDVTAIRQDTHFPLIDPVISGDTQVFTDLNNTSPGTFSIGMSWGLTVMRVPEAWEYGTYGNYGYGRGPMKTGEGITVASIDTGVNQDHVKLHDNWRRQAGWMDGYNLSCTPVDVNGHGTHTVGTICGKDGIGVAPGAQWIACRGCLKRDCLESALLKCCQWMLCPHDMDQSEPENYKNCSLAPDLVSNSWGGGQGDLSFDRCAWALRAAGIIPVWAIGNAGPNCTTASSPGDLEQVIGVGATDENDELCKFSSRGPTVDERLKPDVSAPGMHIKSCWFNSSTSFFTISGTSMATPHVSGLVALILQRCRLPYETVLNILQTTADRTDLGQTSQVCGGTPSNTFPNNFYGYGRVNALKAVQEAVQLCRMNQYYSQTSSGYYYQPQAKPYHPYY